MLTHLTIKNIVLIEKAELDFSEGLCVLSGETGAGKSILLDALGLALGNKGDAKLVRHGQDSASVTAHFHITMTNQPTLTTLLQELGIEQDGDDIVIRRTVNIDGKSRAFINDEAVSAKALKEIGECLIEIHGQNGQRGLMDSATHREALDAFGTLQQELQDVGAAYALWKKARQERDSLKQSIEQAARERDYLKHMHAELSQLNPQAGEEETLSDTRLRMMQSEKLAGTLDDALTALNQPRNVMEALRSAQNILTRSTLKDSAHFASAIDALEKAMHEVSEARDVLEVLGRDCAYDPHLLEETEERLFALKAAARKYNLTIEELPTLLIEVDEKLRNLDAGEKNLTQLAAEVTRTREAYTLAATALSARRKEVAAHLEDALHQELAPLKMESTRFRVMLEDKKEDEWNQFGAQAISFEVATNKGAAYGKLDAIASGGELSRFMLALAVVLGGKKSTPTLIFDEIDAGTGGAVADAIGKRLQRLGTHAQVLVVTHAPQVAARGNQHLFIQKQEIDGHTTTQVRTLDATERHEELARMLSGATITEEARKAAGKLLEDAS
jgi:DNA repair protein RecN (Recombination protein N)